MFRFFVSPNQLRSDAVTLTGDLAHRLGRVLRLRPGDRVVLLDGTGLAHEAELVSLGSDAVRARIVERYPVGTEPELEITLFQALPKGKKLELILQKGTEVGVSTFAPITARYCVAQPAKGRMGRKFDRWGDIIREAAEQAGRARLPRLLPIEPLEAVLAPTTPQTLSLLPTVVDAVPLRQVLEAHPDAEWARVYIGPEGGFAPEEIEAAIAAGVTPISLGPRILRTETAGLVVASLLLYHYGDMDTPPPEAWDAAEG